MLKQELESLLCNPEGDISVAYASKEDRQLLRVVINNVEKLENEYAIMKEILYEHFKHVFKMCKPPIIFDDGITRSVFNAIMEKRFMENNKTSLYVPKFDMVKE